MDCHSAESERGREQKKKVQNETWNQLRTTCAIKYGDIPLYFRLLFLLLLYVVVVLVVVVLKYH